jgi:hypothetical protein
MDNFAKSALQVLKSASRNLRGVFSPFRGLGRRHGHLALVLYIIYFATL